VDEAKKFKFELGAKVKVSISGEAGVIIARAEYERADDTYLVLYKQHGTGSAVEKWWDVSTLEAVEG
jgi:hypothetical protein